MWYYYLYNTNFTTCLSELVFSHFNLEFTQTLLFDTNFVHVLMFKNFNVDFSKKFKPITFMEIFTKH